jgi:site-specific DNA-cytosine methylase
VDNPFQSPVILSLCTGMRGLERGLERAIGNITIATYVEIEAFIIYNLVRQMEQGLVDAAPLWSDLKTFPSKQFHGKVHGIIGGYPCQPFSIAGKRNGENDERHLWPHIEQIINAVRPVWCFFENVDDHISLGFDTVYKSLRKMGYSVEAGIFTAKEVGASHERARLYILALEHTYIGRSEEFGKCIKKESQFRTIEQSSIELANAESKRTLPGKREYGSNEGSWQQLAWSEQGRNIINSNSAMANADSDRRQLPVERKHTAKQLARFPYPQGNYQYEWEEPRAVEPGVGCTVNGYNFRNDLLRMYGNGVVEQTAELAFLELIKKHFKN